MPARVLSLGQTENAMAMVASGTPVIEVALKYGVSESTIYRKYRMYNLRRQKSKKSDENMVGVYMARLLDHVKNCPSASKKLRKATNKLVNCLKNLVGIEKFSLISQQATPTNTNDSSSKKKKKKKNKNKQINGTNTAKGPSKNDKTKCKQANGKANHDKSQEKSDKSRSIQHITNEKADTKKSIDNKDTNQIKNCSKSTTSQVEVKREKIA